MGLKLFGLRSCEMSPRTAILFMTLVLLAGCSGGLTTTPDSGETSDAGSFDAGAPDAGPFDAGPSSSRQTQMPLGPSTAPNGFYEYLPPWYGDLAPRPLLIFWHGVGENGNGTSDLYKVLIHGPPKMIAADKWPQSRPFIVLSPQHPGTGCPSRDEIQKFIAWALLRYRVDPKQVFLTGLSCGAIGSWDYLGTYTDSQVAAAVLIAGDPGDPNLASSSWGRAGCNLGKVAIWALHGQLDFTVTIDNEKATMPKLMGCPQPPRSDAVFTILPTGTHDIWTGIYDGDEGDVFAWLLAHPKP